MARLASRVQVMRWSDMVSGVLLSISGMPNMIMYMKMGSEVPPTEVGMPTCGR